MELQELVGEEGRAAGRSRVIGRTGDLFQEFHVATFITLCNGLIAEATQVWTDVDGEARRENRSEGQQS